MEPSEAYGGRGLRGRTDEKNRVWQEVEVEGTPVIRWTEAVTYG
jgi:hypothetical protein